MLVFLFPSRLASGSGSGRPQGSSKERSLSAAPSEAALRCLPRLGPLAAVPSLLLGPSRRCAAGAEAGEPGCG